MSAVGRGLLPLVFGSIVSLASLLICPVAYAESYPVNLSALPPGKHHRVTNFEVHPDENRVVYMADPGVDEQYELFVAFVDVEEKIKLSLDLQAGGSVKDFKISPDGNAVAYTAATDSGGEIELYIVPITGGNSTLVSGIIAQGGSVGDFLFSLDGGSLVYLADVNGDERQNLYVSPVSGASRLQVNPNPVSGGEAQEFKLTTDGQKVVYIADQETEQVREVYACNLDATNCQKMSANFSGPGTVTGFEISPVGPTVVYRTHEGQRRNLYSKVIGGSVAVKLNADTGHDSRVTSYKLTQDGQKVVYRHDQFDAYQYELFWTPVAARDPIKINPSLLSGRSVQEYKIANDSDYVVFLVEDSLSAEWWTSLYSKRMSDANPPVKISEQLDDSFETPVKSIAAGFLITPDSKRVLYTLGSSIDKAGPYLTLTDIDQKNTQQIFGYVGARPHLITPDSKTLVFSRRIRTGNGLRDRGEEAFYRVDISAVNDIYRISAPYLEQYRAPKLSISGDRLFYAYATGFENIPADLFVVSGVGQSNFVCTPVKSVSGSILPVCW